MNAHLTADEQIDWLEGTLSRDRAEHADGCEECRAVRLTLAAALDAARSDRVPEPSPLFWAHQSERIRALIAEEPRSRSRSWHAAAWTTALVTGLALAFFVVRPQAPANRHAVTWTSSLPPAPIAAAHDGDERAWELVEMAGDDADADAVAAAVAPDSGAADRAMQDLTDEERTSLSELLQQELKDRKG
jgi:hypothetical protein